jgi:hypothetical protein
VKVKDLQKILANIDPELDVICYTEDDELVEKSQGFRLMEIENISVHHATRKRDDNHNPILIFENNSYSQKVAIANVTCNF